MVRLKEEAETEAEADESHFNSTMVRLKELEQLRANIQELFQFHYGTIKSSWCQEYFDNSKISIPLWYD